eukprot:475528_1
MNGAPPVSSYNNYDYRSPTLAPTFPFNSPSPMYPFYSPQSQILLQSPQSQLPLQSAFNVQSATVDPVTFNVQSQPPLQQRVPTETISSSALQSTLAISTPSIPPHIINNNNNNNNTNQTLSSLTASNPSALLTSTLPNRNPALPNPLPNRNRALLTLSNPALQTLPNPLPNPLSNTNSALQTLPDPLSNPLPNPNPALSTLPNPNEISVELSDELSVEDGQIGQK